MILLLSCYLSFVSAPPTTPDVVENQSPPPLTMEYIAAIAGAGEPSLSQLFYRNTPYIHHSSRLFAHAHVAKGSQILPNILNVTLTAT